MTHSHFANAARQGAIPSQHVTARDMALLAAHVIRDYPEYYHYFGEKEFTWNKIRQLNRNPLLTMDIGADGLKAGDCSRRRLRAWSARRFRTASASSWC